MLLTPTASPELPQPLFMADGRPSPFALGTSQAAEQLLSHSSGREIECTGTTAQEEVLARLTEEAQKPAPGQAEKEELVRTSSMPPDLTLAREPPQLQTSGLDWSGSVDGATLLQGLSQDLSQAADSDGTEEAAGTFSFPPQERYRIPPAGPAMSRLSEDYAKSSALSESMYATEATEMSSPANRTPSSMLAAEDASTPALSKHSSLTVPAEVPYESPFEAPQFQDEPIARAAHLPEVEIQEVARSAATMPPSQLKSLLSPSPAAELPEVSKGPFAAASRCLAPAKDATEGSPSEASISDLPENGRRQTGMKSLSVLERDGIPFLREGSEAAARSKEVQILSLLRQTIAQEVEYAASSTIDRQPSPGDHRRMSSSHRALTVPPAEILRALESVQHGLSRSTNTKSVALPPIASGTLLAGDTSPAIDEEDLMTTASLQRALRHFCPGEEASRSPIRSPSFFSLAGPKMLPDGSEWIIQSSEIEFGRRIGSGSFGDVFRAQWRHTDVAVKRLSNVTQSIVGDFEQEVALMAMLKHPNIVQFLGACISYPDLAIVTQFMPRGSLFNLLHRANVQLDDRQKLWMALDVAKGMHYLHSCRPPIVHGDVSSKNMLVDRDFSIRVGDFGMSRQRHKAMLSAKTQGQGTAEWTAPEILRGLPYTESCDVYSFGVILWELMTQQVPWSELTTIQVVGAVGWGNRALTIPDGLSASMKQLMAECTERDPKKRPTFEEIIVKLRQIRQCDFSEASGPQEADHKDGTEPRKEAAKGVQELETPFSVPHPEEEATGDSMTKARSLKTHRTM